jgi:hypothetical protein
MSADRHGRGQARSAPASCGPDTSGSAAVRLGVSTVRNDRLQACDAPRREGGSAKYSQSPMAAGNGAVIAIKWHVRGPAWWSILLTAGHLSGARRGFQAGPKMFRQLRRPYGSKVFAAIRKRWRAAPASSTTSSRHSGLSPSLAMVSRIISEHAPAASSQAAPSSGKSTGPPR